MVLCDFGGPINQVAPFAILLKVGRAFRLTNQRVQQAGSVIPLGQKGQVTQREHIRICLGD